MKNKLIYLTGFMASGKSTVGPILANTIGWGFYDLDKLIEVETSLSIKEIFKVRGESYFRKLETDVLKKVSLLNEFVISLGGGTIVDQENLKLIKGSGLLVYLESSPEAAYKRLRFKRDRPALLFDGEDEPTEAEFINRIKSLLKNRLQYYNSADIKINTDNMPVGKTVDKLAEIIEKEFYGKTN
ncbi:MAG: shikimate kinase [Ignavibacteriaceae bacterium]|jgi:shikimate kinase|nr:MAG: shikimate kinase [Ignavibacterium sp.]MDD5609182.1 shikimate kinase [Ignavibacterium sp.]MDY0084003.1 shikimate kinase [Ignavibacteriaceae bacterium]MEB2355028.1 shikimate kinase [Ignavibacteriales bacterium]GIK21121.1 MAG: shikimate kinase [Ignavibacteriota bacterium]